MKRVNTILFAVGMLVLFALACGSDNTGTGVETEVEGEAIAVEEEQVSEPTAATQQVETFSVGDVIEVQDHTIVLNSLDIQGNKITANFTVENMGTSDLTVSSLLSFEARDDNGTSLEQDLFECGTSSMDGSILPGDKLSGNICWDGLATDNGKIYYKADPFSSGAVVWVVEK